MEQQICPDCVDCPERSEEERQRILDAFLSGRASIKVGEDPDNVGEDLDDWFGTHCERCLLALPKEEEGLPICGTCLADIERQARTPRVRCKACGRLIIDAEVARFVPDEFEALLPGTRDAQGVPLGFCQECAEGLLCFRCKHALHDQEEAAKVVRHPLAICRGCAS